MAIRCPVETIRTIGRSTQGVRLINLGEEDRVTSVALMGEKEDDLEGEDVGAPVVSKEGD